MSLSPRHEPEQRYR